MECEDSYKELLKEHLTVLEDAIEAWELLMAFYEQALMEGDPMGEFLLKACGADAREILIDLEHRKLSTQEKIKKINM